MLINELSYNELNKVFKPILQLENYKSIFENISKIFHLPNYETQNLNDIGIKTMYRGFEIKISSFMLVEYDQTEYQRISIKFTKEKVFYEKYGDLSPNPTKKILNDLKKICESEVSDAQFISLPCYGIVPQ